MYLNDSPLISYCHTDFCLLRVCIVIQYVEIVIRNYYFDISQVNISLVKAAMQTEAHIFLRPANWTKYKSLVLISQFSFNVLWFIEIKNQVIEDQQMK